jgi:leucyl-tRNA---protein transferase
MTQPQNLHLQTLQFYATAPYPCSYLEGRMARSQVAASSEWVEAGTYSDLVNAGFRRSGTFIYRPYCDHCKACVPLRVPVARFLPSRAQKRALKTHAQLQTRVQAPGFQHEHYELYLRYQTARHQATDAGTDTRGDSQAQYDQFLLQSHVNTHLVEFREPSPQGGLGALKMVSVIDLLTDGLSAVYTYFEPEPHASFGTYNVLWQIAQAQQLQLPYLHLGYWVQQNPKMAYKARFKPHELRLNGVWQPGA